MDVIHSRNTTAELRKCAVVVINEGAPAMGTPPNFLKVLKTTRSLDYSITRYL